MTSEAGSFLIEGELSDKTQFLTRWLRRLVK
jgi:hypothetical protein